jgi:tetratricopeptide (TPR) repeat protein
MAWQMLEIQGGMKGGNTDARAAAEKALELDDRLAEAHVARGHLQLFRDWDWKGAENSIRRALELDPNNLDAHFYYSLVHLGVGCFPEAIAEIQTAEQLDPLSHQVQTNFGRILLHSGKLEEALRRVQQAIEREPRSSNAHVRLAEVCEAMGKYPEALEIYEKARVLRGFPPDHPTFRLTLAKVYARWARAARPGACSKGLRNSAGPIFELRLVPRWGTGMRHFVCFSIWWRGVREATSSSAPIRS